MKPSNSLTTLMLVLSCLVLISCKAKLEPEVILEETSLSYTSGKNYYFVGDHLVVGDDYETELVNVKTGEHVFKSSGSNPLFYSNSLVVLDNFELWELQGENKYQLNEEIHSLVVLLDGTGKVRKLINESPKWRANEYFSNYTYFIAYRSEDKYVYVDFYRTAEDVLLLSVPMRSTYRDFKLTEKGNQVIIQEDREGDWARDRIVVNLESGDVVRHWEDGAHPETRMHLPAHQKTFATGMFPADANKFKPVKLIDFQTLKTFPEGFEKGNEVKGHNVLAYNEDKDLYVLDEVSGSDVGVYHAEELAAYYSRKNIRKLVIWGILGAVVLAFIINVVRQGQAEAKEVRDEVKKKEQKEASRRRQTQSQEKEKAAKAAKQKPAPKPKRTQEELLLDGYFAASGGQNLTLDKLIKEGLDVNGLDEQGSSLLQIAIDNKQFNTVKYLLKKGADPNKCGEEQKPPLIDLAYHSGDLECAKMLISAGADVNAKDPYGQTALYSAAYAHHIDLVKLLLSKGAQADHGANVLCSRAVELPELTKLLLEAGADPSCQSSTGYTPLIIAAESNSLESVRLLIDAGADPEQADKDGARAIDYAKREGNAMVLEYLSKHGKPMVQGMNPGMLPDILGSKEALPANAPKLDMDAAVKSLGFNDFEHFHNCFRFSTSDFTKEDQKTVADILGAPHSDNDGTKVHFCDMGILIYTVKDTSHDHTADQSRVYYDYLLDMHFVAVYPEQEYVEVLHMNWVDYHTAQAFNLINVTRQEEGWQGKELYIDYLKRVVGEWLKEHPN